MTKCSVTVSSTFYLVIGIIWIVMGSSLWLIPTRWGDTFIDDNCQKAIEGKFDDMNIDLSVVKYDVSDVFREFVELDEIYAQSINEFMCTDFCICPGTPLDAHYKEYKEVEEETYAKYNRTF